MAVKIRIMSPSEVLALGQKVVVIRLGNGWKTQPRVPKGQRTGGQFASKKSGGGAGGAEKGEVKLGPDGLPVPGSFEAAPGPQVPPSDDLEAKVEAALAGKPVEISSTDADDMLLKMADAPSAVDLTVVTCVDNPGLYSSVARTGGRARVDMPQIPKEKVQDFEDRLKAVGVRVSAESVDPASLKPTQRELDGRNSGRMLRSMRSGQMSLKGDPILVSRDGHILDGHHRWAAASAISSDARGGGVTVSIPIVRVDMPMSQLLKFADAYNAEQGIAGKPVGFAARGGVMAEKKYLLTNMATDAKDFAAIGAELSELDTLSKGPVKPLPGDTPPKKKV